MNWKSTTALFCIYGIVKEFRPATPFLTPFLISNYKNLTLDEVYGQIFPFWTYSYMFFLVPVFILTDLLRYKPIIVLEGACLSITWALLVWGEGVRQMQLMQIFFGENSSLASAAEVAYYSYMYAVVEEEHYRKVTSYIRSAALVGKLLGFRFSSSISLVAVCIVFFIAIALPSVPSTPPASRIPCERLGDLTSEEESQKDRLTQEEENKKVEKDFRAYILSVLKSFTIFKENMTVLKWSIWWTLASCGVFQLSGLKCSPDPDKVENGLVEFLNTLLGAIIAFLVQFAAINWTRYEGVALITSSAFVAIVLAVVSQTKQILVAYVGYICVTSTYHLLITAASCNIACQLTTENYGLVFGWNTFAAVVLQTALTLTVVDSHGLNLSIRTQFVVYAAYFAVVAALFLAGCVCSRYRRVAAEKTDSTQEESD
ncbi:reduced folate carrier [Ostertagia ostertagi]